MTFNYICIIATLINLFLIAWGFFWSLQQHCFAPSTCVGTQVHCSKNETEVSISQLWIIRHLLFTIRTGR